MLERKQVADDSYVCSIFLIKGKQEILRELTLVLRAILYGSGFYFGWQP